MMINFPLKITFFFAIFFPILIKLGLWQINRYEHKLYIEKQQKIRKLLPPLSITLLNEYKPNDLHNIPMKLSGRFENSKSFLLDNQIIQGIPGYSLLVPFVTDQNKSLIVNRGFIPSPNREKIPPIPTFDQKTTIFGLLYQSQGKPFLLEEDIWKKNWPKTIQSINFDKFSEALDMEIPNAILQISDKHPAFLGQKTERKMTTANKHLAYSIQWFFMALVLLILYINQIILLKRKYYEKHS